MEMERETGIVNIRVDGCDELFSYLVEEEWTVEEAETNPLIPPLRTNPNQEHEV